MCRSGRSFLRWPSYCSRVFSSDRLSRGLMSAARHKGMHKRRILQFHAFGTYAESTAGRVSEGVQRHGTQVARTCRKRSGKIQIEIGNQEKEDFLFLFFFFSNVIQFSARTSSSSLSVSVSVSFQISFQRTPPSQKISFSFSIASTLSFSFSRKKKKRRGEKRAKEGRRKEGLI